MIKKVFIKNANGVMPALKKGMAVEGRLKIEEDENGNVCLCFKAWERTAPKCYRKCDRTVFMTDFGRVCVSKERIKVHESIPKKLGKKRATACLERDSYDVIDFLTDRWGEVLSN